MIQVQNRKQHIVYYEWYLDIRAGGPTGYLANLLDGLNWTANNENPVIVFNVLDKPKQNEVVEQDFLHRIAHKVFFKNNRLRGFYVNYISKYKRNSHKNYVSFLTNYNEMYCIEELFKKINLDETKTIHVHTVGDALKVKNHLNKVNNSDIKIILTCHTPEATSIEYYKSYIADGYTEKKAKEIKKGWETVERKAFDAADIIIFPSKESMEPLKATMDGFEELIAEKDIRFLATGAKKLKSTLTKEEAKKKYGVEGKFVIGFVGRHNSVKGYDILQSAAKNILEQYENVCFLIGGTISDTFPPLKHKNWIEAGWVNPADLFMALDVFVLPNRMTYYDLVLLEVMSMGVPVIASATGGNISVQNDTGTLILYNNSPDDLSLKLSEFIALPSNIREEMSVKIENAYNNHFTPIKFAERYKKIVNEIYADYDLL